MSSGKNIKVLLDTIGVVEEAIEDCPLLSDEWSVIKKAYFKKVLKSHPDKGGDPDAFREVQAAFETLRELFECEGVTSFAGSATNTYNTETAFDINFKGFSKMPAPSWEFYAEAAEEPVPTYRVEAAKSGRSACKQKGSAKKCGDASEGLNLIAKGETRIGSIDHEAGSYGRWVHLACWRIPSKIWLGLPNPSEMADPTAFEAALIGMNEVLLSGVKELSSEARAAFVSYCMDQSNWAKKINRKGKPSTSSSSSSSSSPSSSSPPPPSSSSSAALVVSSGSTQLSVRGKQSFSMPRPGLDGAVGGSLKGKTFVMTGIFPEVGGGAGLDLGKARVRSMIEAFGGRVTSSVSGKTDVLVVGKAPGFSKVSKARKVFKCSLMSVHDLKSALEGGMIEGDDISSQVEPMVITTGFSGGYGGNSLAIGASTSDYAIVAGTAQVAKAGTSKVPKRTSRKDSKKTKAAAPKKKSASKSKERDMESKCRNKRTADDANLLTLQTATALGSNTVESQVTIAEAKRMKVVELKAELTKRSLDCSGLKAVLFGRLKTAIEDECGV